MSLRLVITLILSLGSYAASAEQLNLEELFVELPDHEIMATTVLADKSVDSNLRRHTSNVRNCADDLSHIMLRVENAGLHVNGAGVIYTDGTGKSYNFTYNFPAGYDSPWVSVDRVRRPGKCIKSVFVNAKSRSADVPARVLIIGTN